MAAPTFVAEYESSWNVGTTPRTASVTVAAGDTICVVAVGETQMVIDTPTGGGLTYTLAQSISLANYTSVSAWTAPCASAQTFTLSVGTDSGTSWYGFNVYRFSGSLGVGASSKTNVASGAPSLGLTTTAANSAIVVVNGDWNAVNGAVRTWLSATAGTLTEQTYFRDASHYGVYSGYHADAGTAAAKTVGLSAPAGQKYSIIAVEIKGGSGGLSALLGQSAETDTAQLLSKAKAQLVPQCTETDTAQVITRLKSRLLLQATETDNAQALTTSKRTSLSQALETDSALVLVAGKSYTLGQPVEIDTALALYLLNVLGLAVETDTALPIIYTRGIGYWRLVVPRRTDHYKIIQGRSRHEHYSNVPVTPSVIGSDAGLTTVENANGNDIAAAQYYWQGGREHITTDEAIRDLWLANGYEVQVVTV